jgi:hypothetical protein
MTSEVNSNNAVEHEASSDTKEETTKSPTSSTTLSAYVPCSSQATRTVPALVKRLSQLELKLDGL